MMIRTKLFCCCIFVIAGSSLQGQHVILDSASLLFEKGSYEQAFAQASLYLEQCSKKSRSIDDEYLSGIVLQAKSCNALRKHAQAVAIMDTAMHDHAANNDHGTRTQRPILLGRFCGLWQYGACAFYLS